MNNTLVVFKLNVFFLTRFFGSTAKRGKKKKKLKRCSIIARTGLRVVFKRTQNSYKRLK